MRRWIPVDLHPAGRRGPARSAAVGRALLRVTAAIAGTGVLGLGIPAAAALTPPRAPATTGPQLSVTLQLTPPDPVGVRELAAEKGLDRRTRLHRLTALQPSASAAARVRGIATAEGLQVTGSTPYSIQVTGPAATVNTLFGHARGPGGERRGLRVPPPLRDLVSAAVGGDDTARAVRPALRHPLTAPATAAGPASAGVVAPRSVGAVTGAQVRNAYQAPDGQVQSGHSALTIATVQLSGWDNGDLTAFATAHGHADPVASGQYVEVSVDGADPSSPDGYGGDAEVALDQEALLDTAPYADQRAYFAPNTWQGFVDAVNQVATDASTRRIGALSISWGLCETGWPSSSRTAMGVALANATAAGVTVFVASGDSGAYGCDTPTSATGSLVVDYPAADPSAIGTGGTRLDTSGPTETVWWQAATGSDPDYKGSGGGGGYSLLFSRPGYQDAASPLHSTRGVPDLSLTGDPSSGMVITYGGGTYQMGGTSLSAPLAAATLTDLLQQNGQDAGVGDIHEVLYSLPAGGFRDITGGTNGYYAAGTGYDVASGLGAPQWTSLAPALLTSVDASTFTPVTPCRVFDTRTGSGTCTNGITVSASALGAGRTLTATVAGRNGIPSTATAVVLNVTAVSPTASTYVTVYPAGGARPTASNLNVVGGQSPAPNLVTVPLGSGGAVTVYNNAGSVHLVADVAGYYSDSAGSPYTPVTPCRVFDTRTGSGTCTNGITVSASALGAGRTLTATVAGRNGIPSTATAVVLNVTAVSPTASTYVTVYPAGGARPTASNLNLASGQGATPNLVVVPIGSSGKVTFYNNNGNVHLIADVAGYYAPSGSSTFVAITPCRVFDTRSGASVCPAGGTVPATALGAGRTLTATVAGRNGIPSTATAVVLNVTAVSPTASTYVTVYPAGGARPTASNLNLASGQGATPNLVVVPIGSSGKVTFYNNNGSVHLIADVAGYLR